MLKIETRPDGHLKLTRRWWQQLELNADDVRLVARHAGTTTEWPDGFLDRLEDIGMAALQFHDWLAKSGAPVIAIGEANALVEKLGRLVADFGIYTGDNDEGH